LWKKFAHFKDVKWKIGPLGQNDHSYYKNIYNIIKKELENLGRNWDRGNFTFRNIDCGLEGPFLKLSDKYLATGEDFIIKLWNRTTWNCDKVFQGHENHVECVHFYHNFLISSSWDKTIRVWNLETTELASFLIIFTL
jgi:WD40 repeat protein